jgi:two-component system NtrC family sensor kinase
MLGRHHLARRLIGLLFGVMAGGFALFVYLTSVRQSSSLVDEISTGGRRAVDLLARSADYAMLQNRRDLLTRMIRDVGREPGIEAARIYNKKGMIALSSDSTEEGTTVDMQAEACNVCHGASESRQKLLDADRTRFIDGPAGRTLGVIHPIYNRPECSGPPCHVHPPEQSVLGLLEVRMNLAGADAKLAKGRTEIVAWGVLFTLLVAGLAGYFVHYLVHKPVMQLTRGTREIAAGNLDVRLEARGGVELASLAEDFNVMAERLTAARTENEEWAATLERRVEEKKAELQETHHRMLQLERMASLGQLAATVAHEINNPLSGVLTYAKLLQRRATRAGQEVPEELKFIADETARCGDIVKNLLGFARRGTGDFSRQVVGQLVDGALQVVAHQFTENRVEVHRELDPLEIHCDGAQIRQALVAMFVNAVEAMPDGGDLYVRAKADPAGGGVVLEVEDTGIGIGPDDIKHVFEPFFTTKLDGKGVGLGLSVVYGIVARHGGHIDVQSQRGKGTTFRLRLPYDPPSDDKTKETTHDANNYRQG